MEQEPNYVKGFNDGYKLARYSPDLFEKLKESLSQDKDYDSGVLAGAEQWEKEKEKQRLAELEGPQAENERESEEELERE
ncbi:MAG: hypothetical protein JWO03_3918 [Bacteroidetes bacterium]|nr:hypothetical protein [Bacteroidota bacterium]